MMRINDEFNGNFVTIERTKQLMKSKEILEVNYGLGCRDFQTHEDESITCRFEVPRKRLRKLSKNQMNEKFEWIGNNLINDVYDSKDKNDVLQLNKWNIYKLIQCQEFERLDDHWYQIQAYRQIWIAYYKNEHSLFATLPKDLVRYLQCFI